MDNLSYYHEAVDIGTITVSTDGEPADPMTRAPGPIDPLGELAALDPMAVEALAQSIKEIGLLHPIGITESHELIHGRKRLAAAMSLGWTEIPAFILQDFDAAHRELVNLDENLERAQLTDLARCQMQARQKLIYETLHPETRQGKATEGKGPPQGAADEDPKSNKPTGKHAPSPQKLAPPSFAKCAGDMQSRSSSTIREEAAIGAAIAPAAAEKLVGTKVADNKAQLKVLSKLRPKDQISVATLIGSKKADNVKGAMTQLNLLAKPLAPPSPAKDRRAAHTALSTLISRLDVLGLTAKLEKPLKQIAAGIGD